MAVKLFIGGLSFSTSTERLREAFAGAGTVESASVVTDRETGRSRGFGFVEMATPEDAEQAISRLNGTNLDGRTILVEKAKSPGSGGGDRRGAGGGRGGSAAAAGSDAPYPSLLPRAPAAVVCRLCRRSSTPRRRSGSAVRSSAS